MTVRNRTVSFNTLSNCLAFLAPSIRSRDPLYSGPEFEKLKMRPREVLGNWLICALVNFLRGDSAMTLGADPAGGDGLIINSINHSYSPTEHVMVPRFEISRGTSIEDEIVKAIGAKNERGPTYAAEKSLVVFSDTGGGKWYPNAIERRLPDPFYFQEAYVVGLHYIDGGSYVYFITELRKEKDGQVPCWLIRIAPDFSSWIVEPLTHVRAE